MKPRFVGNKIVFDANAANDAVMKIIEEEMDNLADKLVDIMKQEVDTKPDNPSRSAWYTELRDAIRKLYIRRDGTVVTAAVGREMVEDGENPIDGLSFDTMRALVVVYGMKEQPYMKPGELTYHNKLTSVAISNPPKVGALPDTWFHGGNDAIANAMRRIEDHFNLTNETIARRIGNEALSKLIRIERVN